MRQLAVYLTRVQPAKLNITWGPFALIFSLASSRTFPRANCRIRASPISLALPRFFSMCTSIRECRTQKRRMLPVTFRASRSVIAPTGVVVNCWPLLSGFIRYYERPSTVGIDKRGKKEEYCQAHRLLEEVSFHYLFVSRISRKLYEYTCRLEGRKSSRVTVPKVTRVNRSQIRTKRTNEDNRASSRTYVEGRSQGRVFKPRRCLPGDH